eukprot:1137770-Pelagomonas_calceolata.AAC.8
MALLHFCRASQLCHEGRRQQVPGAFCLSHVTECVRRTTSTHGSARSELVTSGVNTGLEKRLLLMCKLRQCPRASKSRRPARCRATDWAGWLGLQKIAPSV